MKDLRLERLVRNLSAINSRRGTEEILEEIVRSAADLFDAEGASLLLLDPVRNRLVFRKAVGPGHKGLVNYTLPVGEGIAGWVAQNNQSQIVLDPASDPRYRRDIAEAINHPARQLVAVPLRLRGVPAGAMEIVNPRAGSFDSDDLFFAEALADLAAIALENARQIGRLELHLKGLARTFAPRTTFEDIVTEDPIFREVLDVARRVAASEATVLLRGASGTGKERLAQAIHNASPRAEGPFIAVSTAAIPDTLLEAEFFGYEKGAFTGATERRIGRFEQAEGGSLFLDEIGEMPMHLQAKLLRALAERRIERLGGNESIEVDCRILAATNRDLEEAIARGVFREDLFYRLSVVPLRLPPLSERRADILPLTRYFARGFPISPAAEKALSAHDWPGNVREIENAIQRAVLLAEGSIEPGDLGFLRAGLAPRAASRAGGPVALFEAENEFRREFLIAALARHKGNRTKAAQELGIQRTYLIRLIKNLGIDSSVEEK